MVPHGQSHYSDERDLSAPVGRGLQQPLLWQFLLLLPLSVHTRHMSMTSVGRSRGGTVKWQRHVLPSSASLHQRGAVGAISPAVALLSCAKTAIRVP